MNDFICGFLGYLIGLIVGAWLAHPDGAGKEPVETPPNTIQCIAGPHPQNPEYIQLECEIST